MHYHGSRLLAARLLSLALGSVKEVHSDTLRGGQASIAQGGKASSSGPRAPHKASAGPEALEPKAHTKSLLLAIVSLLPCVGFHRTPRPPQAKLPTHSSLQPTATVQS